MTYLVVAAWPAMAHDPHDPFVAVAVSPNFAQDQTVLAATGILSIRANVQVVMKSTDGGVNWSVLPGLGNNGTIAAVAFSPGYAQDQTMYVATNQGLFQSINQGTSWVSLYKPSLESMALSPNFAADNTIFVVTTANTVMDSTNRGQTWTAVSTPSPLTAGLTVIAVSPNFDLDQTLFVGTNANGIFGSANAGAGWTSVTPSLGLPTVSALAFSPGFSSDRTVIAATEGQGVLVSSNAGSSWAFANSGLADPNVTALALSPAFTADSTIWAATGSSGVFQSTTLGASWNPATTVSRAPSCLTQTHYLAIAAAGGPSGTVLFLATYEGMWTSTDAGSSWQYIDTLPTRIIRHVHMSPTFAQDGIIFASAYGSGNLWSSNAGVSWTFQNSGMQAPYTDGSGLSPNFINDGTAFSSNYLGLQRTNDWGATWQMMQGTGIAAYPRALAISPNFANDQTVFIGGEPAATYYCPNPPPAQPPGLYISTDAGNLWALSSLNSVGVDSIAMSPGFATDVTAFASSPTGGLYRTTNAGVSWTLLTFPGSPGGMAVVAVSPNFSNDGTVLAGGISGGIYRSTNRGNTWTQIAQTASIRALDIQFSPNFANDQTLFVGTVQEGLMMSTSGGHILTPVTTFPDTFAIAVGISPNFAVDGTIFTSSYHGLFESTNRGATWSYVNAPSRIEETRNITSYLQEPPTIDYDGLWSFVTGSLTASTYGYATTMESQNTAAVSFIGSGIRWVSLTGQDQGTASIQLDGVPEGTVSLYAANPDQFQQTVWEQHGIACGTHTFTITALPQVLQSVALDAFDIWIDTCPATIYSNPAALDSSSATVGSAAGSGTVTLTTTGSWTAYSNAPWLSVSTGSTNGFGNAVLQYTYNANPNAGAQIGTLTIAGLTFYVTQAGASGDVPSNLTPCAGNGQSTPVGQTFAVPLQVCVTDAGGNPLSGLPVTFSVTPGASGASGAFSASPPMPIQTNPAGSATAPVLTANGIGGTFTVTASLSSLSATFTLTNLVYTLGAYSAIVGNTAGAGSVLLLADGPWTAISNASWLQLSEGSASGAGNALIQFSYGANQNASSQTGTLTIAGLTFTVTQAGASFTPVGLVTTLVSSGLNTPRAVAVDAAGNVYISDSSNNAIKEWSISTGQVSTLISEGLNFPAAVAVDANGNVYIADRGNNAIKEWTVANRQVTALVSTGIASAIGLAVDSLGNVYFSDTGYNTIQEWVAATNTVVTLVSAGLHTPEGVAVDAQGNVYFADSANNAIKEWSASGNTVTTLVSSGLNAPYGVAVDGDGNVYFSDTKDNAVKEWSPATLQVTTLISTGIKTPCGVAVDGQGNVYIADTGHNAVKEFAPVYLSFGATVNERASAGTDSIPIQVLPANTPLTASSNQSWLTITGTAGGTIGISFEANTSANSRSARVSVLGQVVTVTQSGDTPATITRIAGNGQSTVPGLLFPAALQVRVKDAAGDAVQLAQVTFIVTPGPNGAGGTFSSSPPMPISTGPDGYATAPTLVANGIAGNFTVTASVGNLGAVFSLTITNP